jgi:hypothetical protein
MRYGDGRSVGRPYTRVETHITWEALFVRSNTHVALTWHFTAISGRFTADLQFTAAPCHFLPLAPKIFSPAPDVAHLFYKFNIILQHFNAQWSLYVPPVVTICTTSCHYMYRQWSLYVPHSGHYMYRQFNIQQFYILPTQCICVFCVDLRTNSHYFPIQHYLTGFYN